MFIFIKIVFFLNLRFLSHIPRLFITRQQHTKHTSHAVHAFKPRNTMTVFKDIRI